MSEREWLEKANISQYTFQVDWGLDFATGNKEHMFH